MSSFRPVLFEYKLIESRFFNVPKNDGTKWDVPKKDGTKWEVSKKRTVPNGKWKKNKIITNRINIKKVRYKDEKIKNTIDNKGNNRKIHIKQYQRIHTCNNNICNRNFYTE